MAGKYIPSDIKQAVIQAVEMFNHDIIQNPQHFYLAHFRGSYLYLGREYAGSPSPVCRLKYQGKIDNWDFAIYKFSKNKYDPDDFMFPGMPHVNGTSDN